jgi:hypothetical protein
MLYMYIGLMYSILYSCHVLMKLEFSRHIFETYSNINIYEKLSWRVPSCSMWTDRQTNVTKLIVGFRNFAKANEKQGAGVTSSGLVVIMYEVYIKTFHWLKKVEVCYTLTHKRI